MNPSRHGHWAAVPAALLLSACGIDQGGVHDPPPDPDGAMIVYGPISGFGSVLLNGLVLEAGDAQILVDGGPTTESALRQGQVIRAIVLREDGIDSALVIDYQQNVIGPIQGIDVAGGALTVLGQPVVTDVSTRFDIPQVTALGDLELGDRVVISGLRTPAGAVLATYVGAAVPAAALKVAAPITALDQAALSFQLGSLVVDYSAAVLLELPGGMPAIGLAVEVTGTALADDVLVAEQVRGLALVPGLANAAATQLTASEIPVVGGPAIAGGVAANIAGFVTAANLPDAISLTEVEVLIDASTTVIGGSTTDLQPGVQIRVEGPIPSVGFILADRITIL